MLSQINLHEFIGEIYDEPTEKDYPMMNRMQQLRQAKKQSRSQETSVVFETTIQRGKEKLPHREFFRFDNGELEEYDCTSYYGVPIKLFKEEAEIINNMDYQNVISDLEVFIANTRN
jgi:hypothetical protein